jgi:phosphonoacetaldehyde hydrolase
MDYKSNRSYRGQVKLVVFDWAGTTIDYGCIAPAAAFVEGFRRKGIQISIDQAREPMGMEKRAHIETISRMEPVIAQWQEKYHQAISSNDIDEMYDEFVPVLMGTLPNYSTLIPGTVEAVNELREMNILIGSSTGYFEEALAVCTESAANQGYIPDFTIGATQVPEGRPAPWMIYRTMEQLGVYPVQAVVKVGDTIPDIEAGLNAGVWTIGVAQTSNEVGLAESEWMKLNSDDQMFRLGRAFNAISRAGAHYVVKTVFDVPEVIMKINERLRDGERP